MNLEFFNEFHDRYLHTPQGQGVFLAGVALGQLATRQVGSGGKIDDSPLFKQMHFGKMAMRDLQRHLSRVPELTRAYNLTNAATIEMIMTRAGGLLFQAGSDDLGVKGNFAFTVAFMNSYEYVKKIFHNPEEGK